MHEQRIKHDFNLWVDGGWPMKCQYINSLSESYGAGFYAGLRFACECEDRASKIKEGANLQPTTTQGVEIAAALLEELRGWVDNDYKTNSSLEDIALSVVKRWKAAATSPVA